MTKSKRKPSSDSGDKGSFYDGGGSGLHLEPHAGFLMNPLTGAPTLEGGLRMDLGFGNLDAGLGLSMAPDVERGVGYHTEAIAGLGLTMPLGDSNFDLKAFGEGGMTLGGEFGKSWMAGLGLQYHFGGRKEH